MTLTDHRRLLAERHRARHDPGHRLLPPGQRPWPRTGEHARRRREPRRPRDRRSRDGPSSCEAGTVRVRPAAGRSTKRWRPWRAIRARRCWPAARAWSRCCRCGWRRRRMLVDINGAARPRPRRGPTTTASGSGALARHADVLGLRRRTPGAAAGARWRCAHVAHATIRNRGTTVGSIVHADAAAEMPVVLRLLGGSRRRSRRSAGRRTIAADDLFVGPLESHAAPRRDRGRRRSSRRSPAGAGVAFEEIARRHGDYALCGVAALVASTATPSGRAGYLSVCDVPTVVDLTAASPTAPTRAADGGASSGSTRPTTSTPPPPTAPSWCGCSPPRVVAARRGRTGATMEAASSEPRSSTRSGCSVNGVAHDVARAGPAAALRRAAPRPRPDRHPRRLRARRLRRVHGAASTAGRCGRA